MLETKSIAIESVSSDSGSFHLYRLKFNKAFLNGEFDDAYHQCLQIMQKADLSESESFELLQFLLLLGKIEDSIVWIDKVLAVDQNNHRFVLKKLEILRLSGDEDQYRSLINQRISQYPQVLQYYQDFADFLSDTQDSNGLENLYQLAEQNGVLLAPRADSIKEASQGDMGDYQLSDGNIMAYMNLFAARENCFARQWVAESGKTGYTPVFEPPNSNTIRNHLNGTYTVGYYQLDMSDKVKWIVFDLDIDKQHLDDYHDHQFRKWTDEGFEKLIRDFRELLSVYHILPHVEYSGYKGYHIWILLEERISAAIAKSFAQRVAAQISLNSLPIGVEVFPKQTTARGSKLGNLVKLPYGIHRLTGYRSQMVDEKLQPIALEDFLQKCQLTSLQDFISALSSMDPAFSLGSLVNDEVQISDETKKKADYNNYESISTYEPENDLEWLHLKKHCPALSQLEHHISTSGEITAQQKLALKYSCGYLKNGVLIVNYLLRMCRNIEPSDLLKSCFKGNAISCNKMQSYLSDLISFDQCDCDFSDCPADYASPLNHLHTLARDHNESLLVNNYKLRNLIESYLKIKKQFCEVSEKLEQIEKDLIKSFADIGVDKVNTPYGTLRKISSADSIQFTLDLK